MKGERRQEQIGNTAIPSEQEPARKHQPVRGIVRKGPSPARSNGSLAGVCEEMKFLPNSATMFHAWWRHLSANSLPCPDDVPVRLSWLGLPARILFLPALAVLICEIYSTRLVLKQCNRGSINTPVALFYKKRIEIFFRTLILATSVGESKLGSILEIKKKKWQILLNSYFVSNSLNHFFLSHYFYWFMSFTVHKLIIYNTYLNPSKILTSSKTVRKGRIH